ncbi:MAG: alpha/beta hydrolase [Archangium sp.]|nr:alpha/beta hydrolase [Archangium sp.]
MPTFHPDLRLARFFPNFSFGPRTASMVRKLTGGMRAPTLPPGVTVEVVTVPGPPGAPDITLRLYRPDKLAPASPALLWIHGGGFIIGNPKQDELGSAAFAKDLGIVVAAVQYRLAPQHPFPAPLHDCYAGLEWLHANAATLGIDPDRIAIGGASAGGGLTAGLALLAHDRQRVKPAFQLLIYPMIDDRTVTRTDVDASSVRIWSVGSNRYGWRSYLGQEPGSDGVSHYSAPARREDLSGLPPAWIGVGTLDLFHDEDLAYAKRLGEAKVACELTIIPGAYHGFDAISPKATVSRAFRQQQVNALRRALFPPG